MGLIAAAIEEAGIPTVTLNLLRMIAEKVAPPRALHVPFAHGYPLDKPNDPAAQRAVLEAALQLLERNHSEGPVLEDLSDFMP